MKKKLLAALISVAMVATLLAGCGGGGDEAETTTDTAETEETADAAETEETADADAAATGDLHLEIVSKGLQHAYWQAVLNGVNSKAEELGVSVNFVGPDSESNIQQQVQQLETALNANPSAIGLAALDTNSVMDLLQTAMSCYFGEIGVVFIAVILWLFSFSTFIGILFYARPNIAYLFGDNWISQTAYKLLALVMLFIGGLAAYTFVWDLGDVGVGLMTIFNLIALIPLSGEALKCLKDYEAGSKSH